MNWLDILILVLLVIALFLGLKIGIIKAALSLAGLIIGITLAGRYYVPLSEQLTFILQANIAKIVAFAIILVGVMVIAGVIALLLRWLASRVMLGWVDHLGGALFGLVLGGIFCAAGLTLWAKFLGMSDIIGESTLAIILLDRFPVALGLLPEEFDAIRSFFR